MIALTALACLFFALSCGTTSQPQDTERMAKAVPTATPEIGSLTECLQLSGQVKADKIKVWIGNRIGKDSVLLKHFTSAEGPNDPPKLSIDAVPGDYDYYSVVHFKGDVSGTGKLVAIPNLISDLMEKGCVQKVLLHQLRPNPANPSAKFSFEWSHCEYPTRPCPNGECADPCPRGTNGNVPANNTSNQNSNTSANGNANGGSNANARPKTSNQGY